jgi:hypothetical protein
MLLKGGNLVNLTMHAPWCITGCPSNNFQTTCKGQAWGGSQGFVLQEYHGGMWGKGAWRWLQEKSSSGRSNNASKGVDENVSMVQPHGARGREATKQAMSTLEKNRARKSREAPRQVGPGWPAYPLRKSLCAHLLQVSHLPSSLLVCLSLEFSTTLDLAFHYDFVSSNKIHPNSTQSPYSK